MLDGRICDPIPESINYIPKGDFILEPSFSILETVKQKEATSMADYDENDDKVYAGITVAHPNGGTKEQVAGLYAQRLAEQGYVTIAADASYQSASHIRTYWVPEYVDDAVAKLSGFFGAKL